MGRIIVAITFVVLFAASIVVFSTRKTTSLRKNLETAEKEPQIEINNFKFRIFSEGKIKSELSAKQSHFVDPNKVEIFNNVRGYRVKEDGQIETLSCQLATAFFKGRSLGEILNSFEMSRTELDGDVRIRVDENLLSTDSTSYDSASKILYSDLPVTVLSEDAKFVGDNGFTYNTTVQELQMKGGVTGELRLKEEIK